jgi:hypothetical protein
VRRLALRTQATWWNLAAIVVVLAISMNTKFSGPIFFVIAFLALRIRAAMKDDWIVLKWVLDSRWRWLVPYAVCFAAAIFSLFFIWAVYGFRYAPTADPDRHFGFYQIVERYQQNVWQIQHPVTPQITQAEFIKQRNSIPVPVTIGVVRLLMDHRVLPETWLQGFFYTYATTVMRGSFLNGEISITGWWYFFPLCVLYKAPTAVITCTLLSIVVGLILWWYRGWTRWDLLIAGSVFLLLVRIIVWLCGGRLYGWNVLWNGVMLAPVLVRFAPIVLRSNVDALTWPAICLTAPVAIYGGMAMSSNFNLGIRHVLPVLPFLHLGLGLFVARMLWKWRKLGALLAGGFGIALAIESCAAWPNYIAFFNVPAGGTRGGIFHLSDSNLDWGQDLKLLAEWQKTHKEKPLYLCYFGVADPEYYGIVRTEMPGGYIFAPQQTMPQKACVIAISATNYQGTYIPNLRETYKLLRSCEPREVLGGTIFLYDFPLRPLTPPK